MMISEQFEYRGFTFQRMTKDAIWYVCYANKIVNWGQYQNDLKEWVDGLMDITPTAACTFIQND